MDLVEEKHIALAERRQQCREIAGMLDRRPACDAQRRTQLGGDDHGERRLAETWRAAEQDMVRRTSAPPRCLQNQGQLLADALLPDELLQPARSQRRLGRLLVRIDVGIDQPVGIGGRVSPAHARFNVFSAARRRAATSGPSGSAASSAALSRVTVSTA